MPGQPWPAWQILSFYSGDAATNGLAAESFDAVVSSEHMPDKPGFFAEINRLKEPEIPEVVEIGKRNDLELVI